MTIDYQPRRYNERRNYRPHFEVSFEKVFHNQHPAVERRPANKCVGTATINLKNVLSAFSFSPHDMLSTQLSYCFFLSDDDLKMSSRINFFVSELTWSFVTFSLGGIITGSDYHLRRSDTRISPFATWCYMCFQVGF